LILRIYFPRQTPDTVTYTVSLVTDSVSAASVARCMARLATEPGLYETSIAARFDEILRWPSI
jgi:hypothetical protein